MHCNRLQIPPAARFDVRALLDFYKEPDPRVLAARQRSHEEDKLKEVPLAGQVLGSCAASSSPTQLCVHAHHRPQTGQS